MNNKEELITKWKGKFRPDLKLPAHSKRKIFNIYKKEIFEDLYDLLEKSYEESFRNCYKKTVKEETTCQEQDTTM